jgi:5-methylcytosine-specific restriction endonuclease McrA
VKEYNDRRRAGYRGTGVTRVEWDGIKTDHGHRCAYCGVHSHRLEKDHFEPIALGGAHDAENVVPACRRCNASKNSTPYLLWLARLWALEADLKAARDEIRALKKSPRGVI